MASTLIRNLDRPVTAAKIDWVVASTWMGFTPRASTVKSIAGRQSTIVEQMGGGYVMEYITKTMEAPVGGWSAHPGLAQERAAHKEVAGRLIAIHQLMPTAKHLDEILGPEEYAIVQDRWSKDPSRKRWSVAFPIVRSFDATKSAHAGSLAAL